MPLLRRGGSGSVSGGGSSAKRGSRAQCNGGSVVASARRLWQIHQHRPQMRQCTRLRTAAAVALCTAAALRASR